MGHQVTDGDVALAVSLEAGDVRRHRVVKPEAPVLDKCHHGRGPGHHLGQRSEIEDRIKSHRLFRRYGCAEAKRFFIQGLIALADDDDGARGEFRGHGLGDESVDPGPFDSVLTGRLARQNLAHGGQPNAERRHGQ